MRLLIAILLGLAGPAAADDPQQAAAADQQQASAAAARHAADFTSLQAVQARLRQASLDSPRSFDAQLAAAEGYLDGANRLRNERKIVSNMPSDQDAEYRAQQAKWAEEAIPLAERALSLATNDAQQAQAERVLGELHAHLITGMLSGMVNGPRARRHIGRALELAPKDPECERAIGLMYLNNPPISGGDVPKAIATFKGCAEALPDERCLVLLSMAYRKQGEPERAREAARQALARNPASREAKLLLAALR